MSLIENASSLRQNIMSNDKEFAHMWQKIAAQASQETDLERLQKLAEKLNQALVDRQKRITLTREAA